MQSESQNLEFLGGKVRKWVLPSFSPPICESAPRLKRLALAQGELAHVYDGPDGIQYIAFVELRIGAVRGNHYHRLKQEWLYVSSGEIEFWVASPGSGERVCFRLETGELAFVDAGVAHAFRTVAPGHAVEFSPARFDAADSYSLRLI